MSEAEKKAVENLKKDKNKALACGDITIVNIEDIELVLNLITRLEQINAEHKKQNGELQTRVTELEKIVSEEKSINDDLSDDIAELFKRLEESISKDKIKEKIEELKNENYQISQESEIAFDSGIMKNNFKIQVLKELLKGSE